MGYSKKEQKILLREYISLERHEKKFFNRGANKGPGLTDRIRGKIPKKAMDSLEAAFEKGFVFLFEKGTPLLEKVSGVEKAKAASAEYRHSLELMVHPDTLRALDKTAGGKTNVTKSISIIEGAGLGIFGIGLPDIPVFLAMLLKTAYEIGASYGFDFRLDEERPYTLALLKVAFLQGEERKKFSKECDELGKLIDDDLLSNTTINHEDLQDVSKVLATDMLVAKFIQGTTFLGVVGGAINYRLAGKIATVAKYKYKKRFLYRLMQQKESLDDQ